MPVTRLRKTLGAGLRGLSPRVHVVYSSIEWTKADAIVDDVKINQIKSNKARTQWHLNIHSLHISSTAAAAGENHDAQVHAEASIHMRSPSDLTFLREFERYERLVSHSRCQEILKTDLEDDDVEILQGRNVYRAFSDIVDFGQVYRGVRYIVGRNGESAGIVHKRHQGHTWLDVPMNDSFGQVAGICVNLLTDLPSSDMFIATGCELVMRSPKMQTITDGTEHGPGIWHVIARHSHQSDKAYMTDVFVFDAATGHLTDVMIGLQYSRVTKASMSKILVRLTTDRSFLKKRVLDIATADTDEFAGPGSTSCKPLTPDRHPDTKKDRPSGRHDITDDVRNLVSEVSGIDASEITLETEMADLGIDSLMSMELAREVENTFRCALDQADVMEAISLGQFVACVGNALAKSGGADIVDKQLENIGTDDKALEADDANSSSTSTVDLSVPQFGQGHNEDDEDDDTVSNSSFSDNAQFIGNTPTPISSPDKTLTAVGSSAKSNLTLSCSQILQCFGRVKLRTDDMIREFGLDSIARVSIAGSNRLCTALIVEAFEKLGSTLRTASPGQLLERVSYLPQHNHMMGFVYEFLERDARLIDIDDASGKITRTRITAPRKTSNAILEELLIAHPESSICNRLVHYAGKNLASVLSGGTDGIRVLFGSPEGRELVQTLYCHYGFNRMHYQQMADVVAQIAGLVKTEQPGETLKILEMGGGTGGTTTVMAALLDSLDIPVEYTFTDLSPSMVANARRSFSKRYPFMRFSVHDIEKPPAQDLCGQHLVLASNAIHATHNLTVSARNIHHALRPDGFMLILEMTEALPFMDIIFGLLEGWWVFDDGRKHAVVTAEHWEGALHKAGFGHVDWTDGNLPENSFQKVIIALASRSPESQRLPISPPTHLNIPATGGVMDRCDVETRELEAKRLVANYTVGWATAALDPAVTAVNSGDTSFPDAGAVVIVTGATGSLGSHLVKALADQTVVATVVCINRRHNGVSADKRQADSLSSRGIDLSYIAQAKLRIYETDTSKPQLGLSAQEYSWLVTNATHIIHNAWPMSGTRTLKAFEPQFQTMRNLLDLVRDMATRSYSNGRRQKRVGFQFVSSIGVVGCSSESRVLEELAPMAAVIPGGYTEGKWVNERMLDETLNRYPQLFQASAVRPGQIAGSTSSGIWNLVEHFAFLVKSAQTLRIWPDLKGVMQWLPVDRCAGVMVDLLHVGHSQALVYPVYHLDNPVGQLWKDTSPVLSTALGIPPHKIIPFKNWVERIRRSPLSETENPAVRVADFLEAHFERMSCGGIILDTRKSKEHSQTMSHQGPVSVEVVRSYVSAWKTMGFLTQ